MFRFMSWLLALLRRERFDIGPADDLYMTRWTLLGRRFGADGAHRLFLHYFHRSDNQTPHCHPWDFWSFILWPGYWEHVYHGPPDNVTSAVTRRWHWAGSLLRRKADHVHRVELPTGWHCWTLVWTGPKIKTWYFYCPGGRQPYKEFLGRGPANVGGCE